MTVTYHAGRRIQGTNQDRVGGISSTVPTGGVGGWKELGRTTLSGNADAINVTSLADKRYLMVLTRTLDSGQTNVKYKFNSDSGSNYAKRQSINGGSDSTGTSQTNIEIVQDYADDDRFQVGYIANLASKEKLMINNAVERGDNSGAGNVSASVQTVAKWGNTSNAISAVNVFNDRTGDFTSGSEVVVLGYDPDDTHTDNFWEELSSVTTTSSGTISSGTITAKKYLMYQIIGKKASGSGTGSPRFQFNGDTGSNYAQRNGINGTHYTYGNQSSANIGGDGNTAGEMAMFTGFIINEASKEKLFLGFSAFGSSAGTGSIGNRGEIFDKWTNTSNQITSINCMNLNFDAGAKMTIWGSD